MEHLYQKILSALLAPFLLWGSVITPAPVSEPIPLGATLPSATAVFETSLAAPITSSATTMTLAANSVRGGGSLSGYQCFTVDEGSAQAETICGTISGTTVSSLSRGISQANGTTTVAALQFSHRRAANVKITDFPVIQILKAQNNGEDTFENPLRYASGVSTTTLALNAQNIASVQFVTDAALDAGGVLTATETSGGFVELATGLEAASTTPSGTAGRLALSASIATSTYNAATAPLKVVVTQNNGKIDNNFIATTTLFSSPTIFASTTIYSTTTTGTWTKPSNLKYVIIELVGGGGGGGTTSEDSDGGGGGGGGGYCKKVIPAAAITSTVTVTIGAGGTAGGGEGGTTSFGSYVSSTGGAGGGNGPVSGAAGGGAGGTCTGGDISIPGGSGGSGVGEAINSNSITIGGHGGSTPLGFGGGIAASQGSGTTGNAGTVYGGGGGGGAPGTGGVGAQGGVFITSVFH